METPALFVFTNCHHTIRTVPNLEPDPKNMEDIDSNGEDHLYDVLRYRILSASARVKTTKVVGA
jgi:hypothetical protein